MNPAATKLASKKSAFTLVELLLSMSVLAILMLLIVQVTNQTSSVWRSTTAKADQFREARDAFEAITRNLSQATLNTYYDYFNAQGQRRSLENFSNFVPTTYGRYSELRFRTGRASALVGGSELTRPGHAIFFQAPLGFTESASNDNLGNLLNTWGYYIDFRDDTDRPSFITGASRYRFRLMQFMQPSEQLDIYSNPSAWLTSANGGSNSQIIASNIISLTILPKLPSKGVTTDASIDPDGYRLAPTYEYDSNTQGQAASGAEYNSLHQLPPIVEVTMIAIDEGSASKWEMANGTNPPDVGLSNLFKDSRPANRQSDLESLIGRLTAEGISFRVFSTEVSIRGAKWSREQKVIPSP